MLVLSSTFLTPPNATVPLKMQPITNNYIHFANNFNDEEIDMKTFIYLSTLFIALVTLVSQAAAQNEKRIPVVVELFTSESCSTCPPADKFLQVLEQEQPIAGVEVIALSEHIDYWNRSGWTDPFSSAQFTNRQTSYSLFFKQAEPYTPQMVVDGTLEFVGSRMREGIEQILAAAKNQKGEIGLEIEKEAKNTVLFRVKIGSLPKVSSTDKSSVFLAVTENDLTSSVTSGENSGKTLKHIAVARYLKNIGSIKNENSNLSAEIRLDKNWKRENLNAIVFIQEEGNRRILAVTKISLKNQ